MDKDLIFHLRDKYGHLFLASFVTKGDAAGKLRMFSTEDHSGRSDKTLEAETINGMKVEDAFLQK